MIFFKQLLIKKPKAKFLFVTGESKELILKAAIEKDINEEHFIIKSSPRELVPAYIALSTVSIFFIIPTFSKKASSPTKMDELMGMGVPIIYNDNVGDVGQIINETGAGIAISEFSEEEYRKAIVQINALLKMNLQKIRHGALKRFSLTEVVNRYAEVYKKVLN